MYMEEVTITQTSTTRVENGESWCFDLFEIDSYITEDGYYIWKNRMIFLAIIPMPPTISRTGGG